MTDFSVSSISSIDSDMRAAKVAQSELAPLSGSAEAKAHVQIPAVAEKPADTTVLSSFKQSDVRLKFQVNEETHEITVFVVDRATKEVLRSIPPDELRNLRSGDLLELLA